jgi:hypothetical protein
MLRISLADLDTAVAQRILVRLQGERGWKTTKEGEESHMLRYDYQQGKTFRLSTLTAGLLSASGGSRAFHVFDVWSCEIPLQSTPDDAVLERMLDEIRRMSLILDASVNGRRKKKVVAVEFEGEPAEATIHLIRARLTPYAI